MGNELFRIGVLEFVGDCEASVPPTEPFGDQGQQSRSHRIAGGESHLAGRSAINQEIGGLGLARPVGGADTIDRPGVGEAQERRVEDGAIGDEIPFRIVSRNLGVGNVDGQLSPLVVSQFGEPGR